MKKSLLLSTVIGSFLLGVFISLSGCIKDENNNPPSNTVTDIDGNVYHTVTIGTQVWMVENLKTIRYNDGDSIPLIRDSTLWVNLTTPGYCWYNNDDATYKNTYGALYNWFTVNTGKLAPTGWHVPIDEEWTILTTFLGGEAIAGGKMKEDGTYHWWSPNTGGYNSSGFTAIPCGYRNHFSGDFPYLSANAYFWSSSEGDETGAWYRLLFFDGENVSRRYLNSKTDGFSIRCLKDD
jgi:uncharacterized protein (TIGR02145 family)